jgi:hypothetical protein
VFNRLCNSLPPRKLARRNNLPVAEVHYRIEFPTQCPCTVDPGIRHMTKAKKWKRAENSRRQMLNKGVRVLPRSTVELCFAQVNCDRAQHTSTGSHGHGKVSKCFPMLGSRPYIRYNLPHHCLVFHYYHHNEEMTDFVDAESVSGTTNVRYPRNVRLCGGRGHAHVTRDMGVQTRDRQWRNKTFEWCAMKILTHAHRPSHKVLQFPNQTLWKGVVCDECPRFVQQLVLMN